MTASAHSPELNLGALLDRNPQLRIPRDQYNINVTANNGDQLDVTGLIDEFATFPGAGAPTHLYFHLPLCNYICHFCNYVKRLVPRGREESAILLWSELLADESRRYLDRFDWIARADVQSFYIGGGTAALLLNDERAIGSLVAHVRASYDLADGVEFNIEGNPENFGTRQLALARDLGFNRFSLGVQSLQDEVNEFTKRRHSAQDSLDAIGNLLATGCPFNVDMMFGLPYQTVDTVRADLTTLVELGVPTITIYRLRNADRAEMGIGNRAVWNIASVREKLIRDGMFPELEITYQMRQAAVEVLLEHGYHPSPCGWWSRPGTYPDGNIPQTSKNKWEQYNTMLAFGPGAYGWLTGDREEFVQTHNNTDIARYVEFMQTEPGLPLAYGRKLSGHQAIGTALGFNFKANQPIVLERYRRQFGADLLTMEPFADAFADLLARDLVTLIDDGTALLPTMDGEALHEEIIQRYFHERIGLSDAPVCRR